jgi:hypothetical protein
MKTFLNEFQRFSIKNNTILGAHLLANIALRKVLREIKRVIENELNLKLNKVW